MTRNLLRPFCVREQKLGINPIGAKNHAESAMMESGEFEALCKNRFQSPIAPKGIDLNAPTSKELQDNLGNLGDRPAT